MTTLHAFPPGPEQRSPRRRQWPAITGILTGSTLVSLGIVAALWFPYGSPAAFVDSTTPGTEAASESSGDPFGNKAARLAWAADQVGIGFGVLEAAFAAGDRDRWMDEFYTGFSSEQVPEGELATQAGRYFDNLEALGAAPLEFRLLGELSEIGAGNHEYTGNIAMSFCLAPADPLTCARSEVDYRAYWLMRDQSLHITRLMTDHSNSPYRPQAWETTALTVAVGDRTVVAAPLDSGYDPEVYLPIAEAAAANADDFTQLDIPSYPTFLADEDHFNAWYSGNHHGQSAGYAAYTATDIESPSISGPLHVVIPIERHNSTASVGDILRHEFGHTATLQDAALYALTDEAAWAIEGAAEYIAYGPTMPNSRISDTRNLVANGGCDGDIAQPDADASLMTLSGTYGCSYLAVRYLVDQYGWETFIFWFGAVFHDDKSATDAAQEYFGATYSEVMADITAYIRNHA